MEATTPHLLQVAEEVMEPQHMIQLHQLLQVAVVVDTTTLLQLLVVVLVVRRRLS